MSFNSFSYFLFLPVVYLIFYFSRDSIRWMVLLLSSIVFYSSLKQPHLLAVLALVTLVTYVVGIFIDSSNSSGTKNLLLWLGIGSNILALIVCKYLPFISENLNFLMEIMFPEVYVPIAPVIVSIGVSYFVFQAISYLVDIYLEVETPTRHLGHFALYLMFFPKLLQGPIERGGDLLPQLEIPYKFNYENIRSGIFMFGWGLFKKIVIADRLAMFVDAVYGNVHAFTGLPLLVATWLYALQIYFDFSGYTDMALGSARLFNINLTNNFNSPYLAISIADFWRRWHISFSRWILDYIFKPVQMSLRDWKNYGTAVALLITFIVSGIWHGASWNFVAWGALHGLFLAGSVFYRPWQKKLHRFMKLEKTRALKIWQIIITFNLVCFCWIFFRAVSLDDAGYICENLFPLLTDESMPSTITWIQHNLLLDQSWREAAVVVAGLFVCVVVAVIKQWNSQSIEQYLNFKPLPVRWALYYVLAFSLIFFATSDQGGFIYYRF